MSSGFMEKCVVCNIRKGKRPCLTHGNGLICTLCCGSNRSWSYCNTLCRFFPEEERENILGIQIGQMSIKSTETGEAIRFTSNCFLPNVFEFFTCTIKNLDLKFLNSQTLSVEATINFQSKKIPDEVYFKDKWKKEENWGSFKYLYDYYPLFFIFTEINYKVFPLKTELLMNSHHLDFTDSTVHWNVGMPFSKVKTKQKPISGPQGLNIQLEEYIDGHGFRGNNYAIFSSIHLNVDLKLKFVLTCQERDIDADDLALNFPIKLFFPFKDVIIENINHIVPPGFKLKKKPSINLYNPSNKIGLNKVPIQPKYKHNLVYDSKENLLSDKIALNSYKIFELDFDFVPTVKSEALTFVTTYPIPSSIYNSINKLYSETFAPAIVSVNNYSDKTINASIIAEIQEVSNLFEKDIVIGPFSQEIVRITPTLKEGVIQHLHHILDTALTIKVISEGKTILRSNDPIQVLARDTMIWEIEDPGRSWAIDLSNLVVSWITPHAPAVDEVISTAARKIGGMGCFVDDASMIKEIKAIYDTISEDIRYVNRPFSFGTDEHVSTQRILSPKQTLKESSGNCIDLTVLFASCLEAIGIKPFVVLVPQHAFVGWKCESSLEFLETTVMGIKDFYSAIEKGKKNYEAFNTPNEGNIRLIDVEKIRGKKIYPPSWFS
jgi:hypothetical protein